MAKRSQPSVAIVTIFPRKQIAVCLLALLTVDLLAQRAAESAGDHDARMAWWREAKFGLFVHWGLYAIPAGEYGGKTQPNSAEWIMNRARIPVAEYEKYAAQFNPTRFDAGRLVRLAKDTGMRYLVITAKHHDGFSLFASKASRYNVVEATPFGRDIIRELADACAQEGIRIGFYYSQAQDWHHPGGLGNHWDDSLRRVGVEEYLRDKAYPEARQLLTEYGPIGIFWWDTPRQMSADALRQFYSLLSAQPGVITNDRLGEGFPGDHLTFERRIPAQGAAGQDWEVCMPISGSWGYKSSDTKFLSAQAVIRNLVDIASKGGNYLLNVSPTAEGTLVPAAIERLKAVGAWMKVNGTAIYGTTASPLAPVEWGRCTLKRRSDGGSIYLSVFAWPEDRQLVLPGFRSRVLEARLLAGGQDLPVRSDGDRTILSLPERAPDADASVIEVRFGGPLLVAPVLPQQKPDGSLTLNVADAAIADPPGSRKTGLSVAGGAVWVAEWVNPEAVFSWKVGGIRPGTYAVRAIVYNAGSGRLRAELGSSVTAGNVQVEGTPVVDRVVQHTIDLGQLRAEADGIQTLRLVAEKAGWQALTLHQLELRPVASGSPGRRKVELQVDP